MSKNNTDSILDSVKSSLGITSDCTAFDADLILHINSVFSILTQEGIGPEEGFIIEDNTKLWSEFLEDDKRLNGVKTYMNLKVRMIFDPPTSTVVKEAIESQIKEFEWRMFIVKDNDVENHK